MSKNISKEKREKLVKEICEIKKFVESAQQDENTKNLLEYISNIEKELRSKKYGLVFEEHKENIDDVLEQSVPYLVEDKDLFVDNGGQMNFLIEGDNLASLKLLEKTHKGKIDLIYIDPPYNTGNKDFVYDDNFVGNDDDYKHSKWLSFMEKRLKLASKLLAKDGLILISIDDNEQSSLKILCDNIFGEKNFIDCFLWMKNPNPTYLNKFSRSCCEYILAYAKDKNLLGCLDGGIMTSSETDAPLQNKGNPKRILSVPPNFSICKFNDQTIKAGKYGLVELLDDVVVHNNSNVNSFRISGTFRMTNETLHERLNNGDRIVFKTNKMAPRLTYKANNTHFAPLKLITDHGTTQTGNNELISIFQSVTFSYPKPTDLIEYLVTLKINNFSSTILDFFAGSGTTGHAVMKLNAQDGGTRKFILCTNNENNICRDITYERIKRVIERDNFSASLKYMRVRFLPISEKVYYEYADFLLKHVKELVELENAIDFDHNAEIAIVLTDEELDEFMANLPTTCKTIYLGHDVLPTEEQEKILLAREIKVNIIPNYYYKELEG